MRELIYSTKVTNVEQIHLGPGLLLLSEDWALAELVRELIQHPWKLFLERPDKYLGDNLSTQPRVRLVILDDQTVEESDRNPLLIRLREDFPDLSLLYVAASQNEQNERRARTNGAHYYFSKPLAPQRFVPVLRSFLSTQQCKG